VRQGRRCSSSGCRCQRGELHGPYLYLALYRDGRNRTLYVPAALEGAVDECVRVTDRNETVLAEIAGINLELLVRQQLPTDLLAELEAMHSATVRVSRLANQLLALAKVESAPAQGKDLEVIDLKTIAEGTARDWVPLAYDCKIDIGFELASAPMLGDALFLPDLVNNLIDNGIRYTPPGGTVTVRTGVKHDIPYLTVEDTGPGIPSSERDKVRERFYRVAGSPGEGSGLGLAIVHEVVERHRGILEIYAGEAAGTIVRVSFPQVGNPPGHT